MVTLTSEVQLNGHYWVTNDIGSNEDAADPQVREIIQRTII